VGDPTSDAGTWMVIVPVSLSTLPVAALDGVSL